MELIDLQDMFASRVAGSVKSPWDEIRVHYEHAAADGVPREVFTAYLLLNGAKQRLHLPLEALDLLVKMKRLKPDGQSQTWLWLEFTIDKTGKYKFDYQYDKPPLITEQLKYSE